MNEIASLHRAFALGFALIAIGAYLGGAWTCVAHRRLSPWLIAVALGLVGESLAAACGQVAAHLAPANSSMVSSTPELYFLADLIAQVLGLGSTVLLVLALAASLADLRRKLARSLEPNHVRG